MFECGLGLAVGIRDFRIVQPFTQQEGFAMYFGCDLTNVLDMALFHHKDQVCAMQYFAIDLTGTVGRVFHSVVAKHLMCSLVHWVAY